MVAWRCKSRCKSRCDDGKWNAPAGVDAVGVVGALGDRDLREAALSGPTFFFFPFWGAVLGVLPPVRNPPQRPITLVQVPLSAESPAPLTPLGWAPKLNWSCDASSMTERVEIRPFNILLSCLRLRGIQDMTQSKQPHITHKEKITNHELRTRSLRLSGFFG